MSTTIRITDLTELTTPDSNTLNTVFVVVDKSSGVFTTKQLSLANLDFAIDNVAPVAFATAVDSIEGFDPSRKLLNIFGLSPPRSACAGLRPQLSQTVSGVDCAKCGSHLCPRPAATTGKPQVRAQSTRSQIIAGWSP